MTFTDEHIETIVVHIRQRLKFARDQKLAASIETERGLEVVDNYRINQRTYIPNGTETIKILIGGGARETIGDPVL